MTLLHAYFTNQKVRSEQVVSSALLVSLAAAMGMMLRSWEAFAAPMTCPAANGTSGWSAGLRWPWFPYAWCPWHLPPLLVAFGHQIEQWVVSNSYHVLGPLVLVVWRIVRWSIGLFTTIVVLAVIYQFGTPRRREWKYVLPGASRRRHHLVSGHPGVWFLSHPLRRLLSGLRPSGSGGGYAGLALYLHRQRADRRRVQRPYLSQAAAAGILERTKRRPGKETMVCRRGAPGLKQSLRGFQPLIVNGPNPPPPSTRRIEPAGALERFHDHR